MDKLSRRSLLRALAGGALSTVGTVILARTSLAALGTPEDTKPADLDVQARAAELDAGGLGPAGEAHAQFLNFPGVGFGNGFRNGGFRNGGSATVASATVASPTAVSAMAAASAMAVSATAASATGSR